MEIYAILHIPTGRRYVGSTKALPERAHGHTAMLNSGRHHCHKLQATWDGSKPGAFEIYSLECGIDKAIVFEREQFWMDFFDVGELGFNTSLVAGEVPVFRMKLRAKPLTKRRRRGQGRPVDIPDIELLLSSGRYSYEERMDLKRLDALLRAEDVRST